MHTLNAHGYEPFVWFPSFEEQIDDIYIDYDDSDHEDDEDESDYDMDDLDIGYA